MTEQQQYPQCFDSPDQWAEYQELWKLSQGGKVRFCLDCQPRYRDEMTKQGRCAHPETIFIKPPDGEMLGINGVIASGWKSALAGRRGIVLSPPPKNIRDQFMREALGIHVDDSLAHLSRKEAAKERVRLRRESLKGRARDMRDKGLSFDQIAEALELSPFTVRRYVRL